MQTNEMLDLGKASVETLPAVIERMNARLQEAKTHAEVLEAHAIGELILHYAKLKEASVETQADAVLLITRAEILYAEEYDRARERGEVAQRRDGAAIRDRDLVRTPDKVGPPTVADLEATGGPSKQRLAEWRTLKDAGEAAVVDAIRKAIDEGRVPSKSEILQAAKEIKVERRPDPPAQRSTPARDGTDYWPTTQCLISACVHHVVPALPAGAVWECAAGDGRLADAIRAAGRSVFASDIDPRNETVHRCDFLTEAPPSGGMVALTNPPYNASDEFLQRGLELLDKDQLVGLVILLRHDYLQAAGRVAAFNRATWEVHCNWRPIWIEGTEGQPRWSFHWIVWTKQPRRPPLYLTEPLS